MKLLSVLVVFALSSLHPAMAQSAEPLVGDVLRVSWDGVFKGWTEEASSEGEKNQGYVVFRSGTKYKVATTRVVESKSDGVSIHEIIKVTSTLKEADEVDVPGEDCGFIDKTPAIAFRNTKTGMIRGYFVVFGDIIAKRWLADDRLDCVYGGD